MITPRMLSQLNQGTLSLKKTDAPMNNADIHKTHKFDPASLPNSTILVATLETLRKENRYTQSCTRKVPRMLYRARAVSALSWKKNGERTKASEAIARRVSREKREQMPSWNKAVSSCSSTKTKSMMKKAVSSHGRLVS